MATLQAICPLITKLLSFCFFCSSIESDHGRSVSFSSDKFPPPELVRARLHHTDKIPYSPLAMSNYDMSMPPPNNQPSMPPPPSTSKTSSTSTTATSSSACPLPLPKTTSAILSSGSQLGNHQNHHHNRRSSSHKSAGQRLVF